MSVDTNPDQSLAPFYAGWDRYNRLLVEAVAPLTPDHLALRVTPSQRSIAELAAHIISARAGWFHDMLREGDANIEKFRAWDDDDNPSTLKAAQLEMGLEKTWSLIADCLARWTPADLDATFSGRTKTYTRQWVIWHVIEHDMHHGGELGLTLGAHGLNAPDL